jgi:hypothetical protein
MQKRSNIEEVYIESAKKLRVSLPKFVILVSSVALIWLFGTALLIPVGKGIFVSNIEVSEVVNLIVVVTIFILIIASFREIKNVADALAGFVIYFVGSERDSTVLTRLKRLQKSFRNMAYVILVSLFFLLFRQLLDKIHEALAGVVWIVVVLWAIVSIISVIMAMSTEIEEAAHVFAEKIDRVRMRRLRKRKKS